MDRDRINHLIDVWRSGDESAYNELFSLLYEDLQTIAHRLFNRERDNHTLQTDDLVNKLYLKLLGSKQVPWLNYSHFLNSVARTMRQILIDHARVWQRRADGPGRVTIQDWDQDGREPANEALLNEVLAVGQAVEQMEKVDEEMARIADLKLTLGLTHEEIAERLGLPINKVKREWVLARKFLVRTMGGSES